MDPFDTSWHAVWQWMCYIFIFIHFDMICFHFLSEEFSYVGITFYFKKF